MSRASHLIDISIVEQRRCIFVERDSRVVAATLQPRPAARFIDQDPAHGETGDRQEPRAIARIHLSLLEQAQVRLVDQCRR